MDTSKHSIDLILIQNAQQDQQDSLSLLTELTEQIVYPYVYRLTFDYHLAQDVCQETLIEMLRSLPKLDFLSTKAYFAWVYRTALSKVQRHYRQQGRQRRFTMSSQSTFHGVSQYEAKTSSDQVDRLVNKELFDAAVRAMKSLKLTYRNILTLRCFDGLSYEEIALIDGSTQLACRLRFYKAKNALRKQLARRGFNRSYLLPALTLIGTVTWPKTVSTATAASPVISAALNVSKTTTIIGLVCSKMVAITAIGIIAAGTTVGLIHSNPPTPSIPSHTDLKALITQGRLACPIIVQEIQSPSTAVLVDPTRQDQSKIPVAPQEMAAHLHIDDPYYIRLIQTHVIRCVFPAPLIDGPGNDIFITANGCKGFNLYLSDGISESQEIVRHQCSKRHRQEEVISFDLGGHECPFIPVAIEIHVTRDVIERCGFELRSVCARIQNP